MVPGAEGEGEWPHGEAQGGEPWVSGGGVDFGWCGA